MEKAMKPMHMVVMTLGLCPYLQAFVNQFPGTSFEEARRGEFSVLESEVGTWNTITGKAQISSYFKSGRQSLHLTGGKETRVELTADFNGRAFSHLSFRAERWTVREPFTFRIFALTDDNWQEIFNGDDGVKVGRSFLSQVEVAMPEKPVQKFGFVCTSPEDTGVLIDDLMFHQSIPATINNVTAQSLGVAPVLIRKHYNPVLRVQVDVTGNLKPRSVKQICFSTQGTTNLKDIASIDVFYTGNDNRFSAAQSFSDSAIAVSRVIVCGNQPLKEGPNYFWVSCTLNSSADLLHRIGIADVEVQYDDGTVTSAAMRLPVVQRIGYNVRDAGDDGVAAYRIPGLATTHKGTLIAVYDVRRHGMGDLPGDIDVGMSRSTDGGQTWEPMKVIIDMGQPHNQNGVGDPCVLVDRKNGTIWVAALWSQGDRGWQGSGPGLAPEETGQFILSRSDDDGKTWSAPINITSQIKDPKWRLLFQGPGNGITLYDGTLVFPAQFKDEKDMPYATILFSRDLGQTWTIGTGAKSNTTEAQVVQLNDGSLMLNIRDNRGGSRSVYTTNDLGKTWLEHPSSRSALPEPVCMASLIRFSSACNGDARTMLLFSNPAVPSGVRRNMTIKASYDEGMTWPASCHKLIHEPASAGYSSMTPIDDQTIGILYEGGDTALLVFEKIHIDEILRNRVIPD